tara:strand:+ start:2516 stop:3358 length:843 start_codon:yes stop_codon:yes gene_type:complete
MKIGIIGNGFVGKATKLLKNDEIDIICYDINPDLCEPKGIELKDMNVCEVIFVSVPTPMNKDGSVHLGIVKSVVSDLKKNNFNNNIVIRSTVPPGTCDELGVYFMPEFLTEKNFENDFINNELWVYGLQGKEEDNMFKETISNLINICHKKGCIKSNKTEWMTNKEAEMVKYFRNTFLSVKISYCNELYRFCELKGIDYSRVREIAAQDKRIGLSHTSVPGHDNRFGFGGTCFPKDTNGLLCEMKKSGLESYILQSTVDRNEKVDRKEKDWEEDKGRAVC